jgi:hypothetical protein
MEFLPMVSDFLSIILIEFPCTKHEKEKERADIISMNLARKSTSEALSNSN